MILAQRFLRSLDIFVALLFLFYTAYGSSENDDENSTASDQKTSNDLQNLLANEHLSNLKTSFSHAFTNGTDLDLLDHNALIAHYNSFVHSSNKNDFHNQRSTMTHSSTVTSNFINYFSNDVMDYYGEHKTITNEKDDFKDYHRVSSTFKPGLSTVSLNTSETSTLSHHQPDNFSNNTFNDAFNWSSADGFDNFTYGEDDTANQFLMEQLILYNHTNNVLEEQFWWKSLNKSTQEDYMEYLLGKKERYDTIALNSLTIYYLFLIFVGVIGNVLTAWVITISAALQTPSNYFLCNLAIIDLVTLLLVLPMEILLMWHKFPWPFGKVGCGIAVTFSELVTYVSVGTMFAFTIERYIVICHPLKTWLHFGKVRTIAVIIWIWVISIVFSVAWTNFASVKYGMYNPMQMRYAEPDFKNERDDNDPDLIGFLRVEGSAMCEVHQGEGMEMITWVLTTLLYFLPAILLPYLFLRIAKVLKESERYRNDTMTTRRRPLSNRKTVVRMLFSVFVCFIVCWTPYHVQRMLHIISEKYFPNSAKVQNVLGVLHVLSGCFYFLNSAINPFLYSLFSKQFRSRMYNGFIQKLEHLFLRNRSTEETNDIPAHRRDLNPFPDNLNHQDGQATTFVQHPKILAANCKGHVQSSKAIRRHFGLPLFSKTPSKEQVSGVESPNISQGLAAVVHLAVDDVQDNQGNSSRIRTGILKKPKCRQCSVNNNKNSFKSEKKTQFKNDYKQTKTTFFSDTNLLDGKLNRTQIWMKEPKVHESVQIQNV